MVSDQQSFEKPGNHIVIIALSIYDGLHKIINIQKKVKMFRRQ